MSEDIKMEEPSSETESSSSSEDEDIALNEELEKDFFKTLSCLKSKDPSIYNKDVRFFKDQYGQVVKPKKVKEDSMFIRDYEVKVKPEEIAEEEAPPPVPTRAAMERSLKNEFKKFIEDEDDNEEGDLGGLFKTRIKTETEKEEEDEGYIAWLKGQKPSADDKDFESSSKPLKEYWNRTDLDEKERFLKDFLLNKRFMDKDDDYGASDLSEDERALHEQEQYEHNYNLRFETEGHGEMKRYPRNVETSLRLKDDRRKRKRQERKEKKQKEKEKKHRELKTQQKLKLEEIKQRLEQLKEITGNDRLGFSNEEILGDFDPDVFDKKMEEIFDDQFYNQECSEKPEFEDMNYNDEGEDNDEPFGEDFNMDCEAVAEKAPKKTRREKKKKKNTFNDVVKAKIPEFDPSSHQSFKNYLDEYYSIDCEDFIEDIPCRMKYRSVQPNDFGLSVEEILMADDKDLNKWCAMNKILKQRSQNVEKNEVKIYRMKAQSEELKRKILPSLFPSEEAPEEEEIIPKKKKRKTEAPEEDTQLFEGNTYSEQGSEESKGDLESPEKRKDSKKKRKKKTGVQEQSHEEFEISKEAHNNDSQYLEPEVPAGKQKKENGQEEAHASGQSFESETPAGKKKKKKRSLKDSESLEISKDTGSPKKKRPRFNSHEDNGPRSNWKPKKTNFQNNRGRFGNWRGKGKFQNNDRNPSLSNSRLKAYGISKKKFFK